MHLSRDCLSCFKNISKFQNYLNLTRSRRLITFEAQIASTLTRRLAFVGGSALLGTYMRILFYCIPVLLHSTIVKNLQLIELYACTACSVNIGKPWRSVSVSVKVSLCHVSRSVAIIFFWLSFQVSLVTKPRSSARRNGLYLLLVFSRFRFSGKGSFFFYRKV